MKTHQLPPVSQLYQRHLKRPIEWLCAVIGFMLLLPLLLSIALLLWLIQGGNPLFLQTRIGRHGIPFRLIKFRTMNEQRDKDGKLLPDEQRTTRIGSLLRSSSLDELPEIINVICGDMALIGPRPWIPEQMQHFSPRTRQRRMKLRPGISGLAQVLGRNDIPFRQRICYDLIYQRHLAPQTDLWILLQTFSKVLKHDGIEQTPEAFRTSRKNSLIS